MTYRAITIKNMIQGVAEREYVLPAIQREFVWRMGQIEKLFDSLMRDYPISTFLFWKVGGEEAKKFQFYNFLQEYSEKTGVHNTKINLSGIKNAEAVLDGQQRMTALYLGLTGSYSKKKKGGWSSNQNAYIKRKLYLNLIPKPNTENDYEGTDHDLDNYKYDDIEDDEVEMEYEFRFLSEKDLISKKGQFWFECEKILSFKNIACANGYINKVVRADGENFTKDAIDFACNTLAKFFQMVHKDELIRYYLEESKDIEKVLQIFIRTNSAGTVLNRSDLLFSMAIASWGEDARETVNDFIDDINNIGSGFSFNKDVILKACLVFCGDVDKSDDVKFNVDNFNKGKIRKIEKAWDKISEAILAAVILVNKLGYNDASLISKNAIIPIAYYLYVNGINKNSLYSNSNRDDIKHIKEWLARVLLSGFFGGTADSVYPPLREIIYNNKGKFPLQKIIDNYRRSARKNISFNDDQIEGLLDLKKGDKRTYALLSLLDEGTDGGTSHQDHIHPKKFFKKSKDSIFAKNDELADKFDDFEKRRDRISNLQLLHGQINVEKNDKCFKVWLDTDYKDKNKRDEFLEKHYIDLNQSLEFEDFLDFYEARRQKIKTRLMQILGVKPDSIEGEAA